MATEAPARTPNLLSPEIRDGYWAGLAFETELSFITKVDCITRRDLRLESNFPDLSAAEASLIFTTPSADHWSEQIFRADGIGCAS